jgi:acetyl-CoA decarbonylase/synthase complex subunit gamma
MDKVKHQEVIIPGYAAAIAGDVEEELPGWTITVGHAKPHICPASSRK